MSLNQSMNIALGSMRNYQYALTVVSQNMANVHVPGYHRQRVNFATNEYTTRCENVISTIRGMNGARIDSLTDYIDMGAFKGMIDSNSDANYYNALADALSGLEDIADDLGDNGLNGLLNKFYTASANLEQSPADYATRLQFVQAANDVCEKFNDLSAKYDSLADDKAQQANFDVQAINNLFDQLAQANEQQVKNSSTVTQENINGILQELSNYMDVQTSVNSNGTVDLYVGDIAVVQGGKVNYTLQSNYDPKTGYDLSLKSTQNPDYVITNGVKEAFNSGALKGAMDFLNGNGSATFPTINSVKAALDEAANAFAKALNEIQTFGSIGEGVFAASMTTNDKGELILQESTEALFETSDGTDTFSASNIKVNQKILDDPYLVAAARIDLSEYTDEEGNVDPNWIYSIGNSDNAVEFSALQNKKLTWADGSSATLSQFLTNNATKMGLEIGNIQQKAQNAQDIADMDATNYSNLVGVNLDEELADMIKYQRSFEASARLFTTINDLMGTIINMV